MARLHARSVVGLARVAPSDGQIDGQTARGDEGDEVVLVRESETASEDERILRITEIKNRFHERYESSTLNPKHETRNPKP